MNIFNSIFKKFKNMIITLKVSILSIFISLFVIAMVSLIYLNYHQSSATLLITAKKLMIQVSNNVNNHLTNEIRKAQNDSLLSRRLIEEDLINPNNQEMMVAYTLNLAYQFYLVEAVRWGDPLGNYVKAEYDTDDTILTEIINRNISPPQFKRIHRNKQLQPIKYESEINPIYDPRKRPWYHAAVAAKESYWTDIYRFHPTNALGLSLTTPIYSKTGKLRGVLDLDIGLDWLSWYLGKQQITPNTIIFLITQDGKIIAHSKKYRQEKPFEIIDINKIDTPWMTKSFNIYKKNKKMTFNFTHEGQDYLASYQPIPIFLAHGWLIGIVTPEKDFIGSLQKNSLINAFIGFLMLTVGILLTSAFVNRLVKPIKNLAKEANRIRDFKLGHRQEVKSNIKEIMALSHAIYTMKIGLRSFKKYIPASLVKQLIEAGENARIGGTKKTLTIFFSDIVNFTQFSENQDPNLLMIQICEYFDELSKIIAEQKGTIDKYIGESIRAFWGAPLSIHSPNIKAARAALRCKQRLIELNKVWESQNKPPFWTRFGLHLGDTIVGNLGSSERINYTALGDAVNLASRLEEVNKIYGTTIIVSEPLYQRIKKHFILKKIDNIAVKGKTINYPIYELLAEDKSEIHFNIDAYQEIFDVAFNAYSQAHWDKAIMLFEKCLDIFPEDSVSPVFITRCKNFKLHPPQNWDGVWRIT